MKCIIIDDEPGGRQTLRLLLQKLAPDVEIVGEADGVSKAVEVINKQKPELVFLDIEMPDGPGFRLFEQFPKPDFRVIFATSYSQYALQAIKVSALDYLLKPISPSELMGAIEKAKAHFDPEDQGRKLEQFQSEMAPPSNPKNIIISDVNGSHIIQVEEIVYCQGEGSYTIINLSNGEARTTTKNMRSFEETLPENSFFRCHKSFIVNLKMVREVKKTGEVILEGDIQVEVSRRKKDELLNLLARL